MVSEISNFWAFPTTFTKSLKTTRVVNRKSKKASQHNGQKKRKRTNSDLQINTLYTIDRVTRAQLHTGGEHRCSGRISSSCSTSGTRRFTLVTNRMISYLLLTRLRTLNSSLILCWLMGRLSDWISLHTSLDFSFRILVSIMVNASSKA
jgi:hypothetical protein